MERFNSHPSHLPNYRIWVGFSKVKANLTSLNAIHRAKILIQWQFITFYEYIKRIILIKSIAIPRQGIVIAVKRVWFSKGEDMQTLSLCSLQFEMYIITGCFDVVTNYSLCCSTNNHGHGVSLITISNNPCFMFYVI